MKEISKKNKQGQTITFAKLESKKTANKLLPNEVIKLLTVYHGEGYGDCEDLFFFEFRNDDWHLNVSRSLLAIGKDANRRMIEDVYIWLDSRIDTTINELVEFIWVGYIEHLGLPSGEGK